LGFDLLSIAGGWAMPDRPQKITFAEMRDMGVRGILVYCANYQCSHSTAVSADEWPDDLRLSDIEERFTCSVCGKRGADVRPDFNWDKKPVRVMGYVDVLVARLPYSDSAAGWPCAPHPARCRRIYSGIAENDTSTAGVADRG
jgi:hypothetical protein